MKNMKKFCSLLLVLVMVATLFAGCKKDKSTFFTAVSDANTFEKYTYEMAFDVSSSMPQLDGAKATIKGTCDGKAISMGVSVEYSYITVDIDELLVITDGATYINAGEVVNVVNKYLGGIVDLNSYINTFLNGQSLAWVEIPYAKGLVKVSNDEEQVKLVVAILEEMFDGFEFTNEDGNHSVTIKKPEDFGKLMKNAIKAVKGHKKELKNMMTESAGNTDAIKETVNIYKDAFVSAVKSFNNANNLGMSDSDIAELESMMDDAIEEALSEVNVDPDDLDSAYDELFDALDDAEDEIEDMVDELKDSDADVKITLSNSIEGKAGERTYKMNMSATVKEDDDNATIKMKATCKENEDAKVKKPSDVLTIDDIMGIALGFMYDNGLLGGSSSVVVDPTEPYTQVATEEQTTSVSNIGTQNYNVQYINIETDEVSATFGYDSNTFKYEKNSSDLENGNVAFTFKETGAEVTGFLVPMEYDDYIYSLYNQTGSTTYDYEYLGYQSVPYSYVDMYLITETQGKKSQDYYVGMFEMGSRYSFAALISADEISENDVEPFFAALYADVDYEVAPYQFDGTWTLEGYQCDVKITSDTDMIGIDEDYSDSSSVCYEYVNDSYVWTFCYFDTYYDDVQDYFENSVASASYEAALETEPELKKLNTPAGTVYIFSTDRVEANSEYVYHKDYACFPVENYGLLTIDTDDFGPDGTEAITFEDFVKAIFVDVEVIK